MIAKQWSQMIQPMICIYLTTCFLCYWNYTIIQMYRNSFTSVIIQCKNIFHKIYKSLNIVTFAGET